MQFHLHNERWIDGGSYKCHSNADVVACISQCEAILGIWKKNKIKEPLSSKFFKPLKEPPVSWKNYWFFSGLWHFCFCQVGAKGGCHKKIIFQSSTWRGSVKFWPLPAICLYILYSLELQCGWKWKNRPTLV